MVRSLSVPVLAMMILLLMVPSLTSSRARTTDADEPLYTEVTVRPGDTVWDIAREYGPSGTDIRRTVHNIAEINDLASFLIHPGQTLFVPVHP
ncbi:MAG: LysM peptidoglycan-binding domain-containing protein [Bacillota bacterium]